jgi:hypothetical protein
LCLRQALLHTLETRESYVFVAQQAKQLLAERMDVDASDEEDEAEAE